MRCPDFEALINYTDGQLAEPAQTSVHQHLTAGCATCQATVGWYTGVLTVASTDTSFDPPAWVMNRAIETYRTAQEAAAQRGLKGLVARLRALLVFDSLAPAGASPVFARGAIASSRQLLFNAAPYDVDLLISTDDEPDALRISGQVLAADSEDFAEVRGLRVELVRDEAIMASAETSEFGEFSLDGLQPGIYTIRLSSDSREILLPDAPITVG